jgi:hypothetical protein
MPLHKGRWRMSIEFHVPPAEVLRLILGSIADLTKLRQNECKHLAIENFAPELLRNMLHAYYADLGVTITTDRPHIEIDEAAVISRFNEMQMDQGIRSGSTAQRVSKDDHGT